MRGRRSRHRADAEAARARVARLGTRPAWVPRVPADAVPADAVRADAVPADPAPAPADPGPADMRVRDPGGAGVPAARESGAAGRSGRHRPSRWRDRWALGALDRLPMGVRVALARTLPSPVRHGRTGLEAGHVVVIVLLVILGLAGALVVVLGARPQVEAVTPVERATVLASGTPATGPGVTAPPEGPPGRPDGGEPAAGSAAAAPVPGDATGASPAGTMLVHVAGRVRKPGVVRLPAGARVADAVTAAGGALKGVDLTPLNLARPLADGEQVLVGVEPAAGAPAPGAAGGPAPGSPAGRGDPRVDLNTATAEQLEELPGVGPVLAERILAWRQQHGRFSTVEELQEVSGIGPRTFEGLADQVRV